MCCALWYEKFDSDITVVTLLSGTNEGHHFWHWLRKLDCLYFFPLTRVGLQVCPELQQMGLGQIHLNNKVPPLKNYNN